jgi:uncharacterized delta-60 repeat protein
MLFVKGRKFMFYHAKLLLFVILVFGTVTQIFAAAGDLDLSFGEDGIVNTDSGNTSESLIDLAVQTDGKLVAIGYSGTGGGANQRIVIVRYNVNGTIDTTFGTSGRVIIPQRMPGQIALQPDGKIVFVSPYGASPFANFYVGRLNTDGSFDTTFGGTGTINLNLRGTDDRANYVKVQPDGKIMVGGTSSRALSGSVDDAALVRFNPNGSLDTSFDGDGKLFSTVAPQGQTESRFRFIFQPDGKILHVGGLISYDMNNQYALQEFLVVRYNPDGSLDTTFDTDGVVVTRFDAPQSTRTDAGGGSVVLQSDGKIVVAGTAYLHNAPNSAMVAVARYNTDGSPDSSYGSGGKALISYSSSTVSTANEIEIQADNKIVIAGNSSSNSSSNPTVARLGTNGSLDTSFSGDGWNVVTGPPNSSSSANSIVIQPGGKIVIGGHNYWFNDTEFLLARFESSTCTVNCAPPREKIADFDSDGKTDFSVWRNGTWFISSSLNDPNGYYSVPFASNPVYLTPADFDGDSKTDIAVWYTNIANSTAGFFILRSSTNTVRIMECGTNGDDPRVVGDWDGDGRADAAVYRNGASAGAQSYFFYFPSSAPDTLVTIPWGVSGDEFVRGDFDGDGRKDAAVYRPSNQVWYVRKSSDGQPIFQYWGIAADKRVEGDFDGDGKTDFVAYRDGIWYVLQSSNNQVRYASWGTSGDKVVAGDYDGDEKTDFAVWREGVYYILQNSSSQTVYRNFGIPGDIPIASVFVP